MEEQITRIFSDRPDSIEIGTPGKGGVLKYHFDASKPDEAAELYKVAKKQLETAREELKWV